MLWFLIIKNMTKEDFERLIASKNENSNFEVKGDSAYGKELIKDIVAISNVKYGGNIIIGIKNITFEKEGVSTKNLETYNIDIIKGDVSKYFEPSFDLSLEIYTDVDDGNKNYCIIKIAEFDETPIICKKVLNNSENKIIAGIGDVLYRNTNGRTQSGRINNYNDMRKLIENSTIKLMQRYKSMGLDVKDSQTDLIKYKLNKELNGL